MSTKTIQETIRSGPDFLSGRQFNHSDVRKLVDYTMKDDNKEAISQALRDMVSAGELRKSADGSRYSRIGGSSARLRSPWRKLSDRQIGILPVWEQGADNEQYKTR